MYLSIFTLIEHFIIIVIIITNNKNATTSHL